MAGEVLGLVVTAVGQTRSLLVQPERCRGFGIVDVLDRLELDEVIAEADRPERVIVKAGRGMALGEPGGC